MHTHAFLTCVFKETSPQPSRAGRVGGHSPDQDCMLGSPLAGCATICKNFDVSGAPCPLLEHRVILSIQWIIVMIKLNNTHGTWKLVPFPSPAFVTGKSQRVILTYGDTLPTPSSQDFSLWVLVRGTGLDIRHLLNPLDQHI